MARAIESIIEIDAPVDEVWVTFSDFARWPEWNPFVVDLRGTFEVGRRLEARIQPPGGRSMTFKPTVLVFEPERELRWIGRLVVPGVFDGEHAFRFEPLGESRTRFTQSEVFRGILVPLLMGAKGYDRTSRGFEASNQALKERVEARSD